MPHDNAAYWLGTTDLGCVPLHQFMPGLKPVPYLVIWTAHPFRNRLLFKVFTIHLLLQDSCIIQQISWAFLLALLFPGLLLCSFPAEAQKKFLLKCADSTKRMASIWHFPFCTSSLFLLFSLAWERFHWRERWERLISERGLMQESSETQGQMFPLVTAVEAHIHPHTFSLLALRTVLYFNTHIMKELYVQ